jgi:hypothetical protein
MKMGFARRAGIAQRGRVLATVALVVALAMASLGACTAGDASLAPATSVPPLASAARSASAPSAPAPAVASPSPSSSTGGLDPTAAKDAVVEDLMAAIGNPDTGSSSEAMKAFEAGLASGDAAVIASRSDVVLDHLASGRATIAAVDAAGCDAFCPEWDLMLVGIADGIGAMRDAGIGGDVAAVEVGRARIQSALLDHFWQGIRGGDPDLNVIYLRDGRIANASRMRWSTRPEAAFDGSEETAWTTGDAPAPHWIEVDLGYAASVASVRLLTFQDVAGPTDHRVTVCGADGVEREFARFAGPTSDRQWLEHRTADPVSEVRVVRVTTLATPSTIGWREIEVGLGADVTPGPTPGPSATRGTLSVCGVTDLTAGATVAGQPSTSGREPALAIDDDQATGWDPGTGGSIRITLAKAAIVSEVRLLVGEPAGSPADYAFVAVLPRNERFLIGELSGPTEAGVWRSLSNPTPSNTFSEIEVLVRSGSPAAKILEIQVIGAPLR